MMMMRMLTQTLMMKHNVTMNFPESFQTLLVEESFANYFIILKVPSSN